MRFHWLAFCSPLRARETPPCERRASQIQSRIRERREELRVSDPPPSIQLAGSTFQVVIMRVLSVVSIPRSSPSATMWLSIHVTGRRRPQVRRNGRILSSPKGGAGFNSHFPHCFSGDNVFLRKNKACTASTCIASTKVMMWHMDISYNMPITRLPKSQDTP